MIYQINNYTNSEVMYFVSDIDIQSQGQALNIPNTIWNVGTIDDINALLPSIAQSYLEFCSDRFSVCSATIDENGIQTWKVCDLTQEQPNTDKIYQIFNTLTSLHIEAIGLDNAKIELEIIKSNFLEWSNIKNIIILDKLPKPFKQQTQGTQTL